MNAKRKGLLAVAGCAAACAGVAVVPALLGGAAAGSALAALSGEAGLAVLVVIAAGPPTFGRSGRNGPTAVARWIWAARWTGPSALCQR
jgi:hypothetical protein